LLIIFIFKHKREGVGDLRDLCFFLIRAAQFSFLTRIKPIYLVSAKVEMEIFFEVVGGYYSFLKVNELCKDSDSFIFFPTFGPKTNDVQMVLDHMTDNSWIFVRSVDSCIICVSSINNFLGIL
jgi:hypothetical protein